MRSADPMPPDGSIAPPGATSSPRRTPARSRRTARQIAGAALAWLLIAVAVAVPVAAAVRYAGEAKAARRSAAGWRATASRSAGLLRRRSGQLHVRTAALNQAVDKLALSEDDVLSLQDRQRDLAHEKASAEDDREFLHEAAREQRSCSDSLWDLLDHVAGEDYEWAIAHLRPIGRLCENASDALDSYRSPGE